MVGLKVVETLCNLLELGPGARARRTLACAARGRPDGAVLSVLVWPSYRGPSAQSAQSMCI